MLTNKLIQRFEAAVRAHEELDGCPYGIAMKRKVEAEVAEAREALQAEIRRVRRPAWLPAAPPTGAEVGCV